MTAQAPALREVVAELDDDEILALCYGLSPRVERLQFYLQVLRGRSSERAQLAACLLCFDLAQRGDRAMQAQFTLLAQSLRQVEPGSFGLAGAATGLPHLERLWAAMQAALAQLGPAEEEGDAGGGEGGELLVEAAPEAVETTVPLGPALAEALGPQARFEADDRALWRRYDEAVEGFLGGVVGVPIYDQNGGFRLDQRRDIERIEAFVRQLDSLVHRIAPARGYRALALMFLGSQLKARALFGGVNARKQQLLRAGLAAFLEPTSEVERVVGVLCSLHADPGAWPAMLEVITAFLAWSAASPEHAALGPRGFDAVGPVVAGR